MGTWVLNIKKKSFNHPCHLKSRVPTPRQLCRGKNRKAESKDLIIWHYAYTHKLTWHDAYEGLLKVCYLWCATRTLNEDYVQSILDSSCISTTNIPDRACVPDFCDEVKLCHAVPPLPPTHADFECGASHIRYVLCHTLVQTIGKVNEWEQGFEPTEMEENIQERGLEFSIPNPLSQLLQHNVPRPSLFKLCWISCHVNTRNYLVYYNYDD